MNKLFTEFENENSLRVYPFASGCTVEDTSGRGIGTGVLIDAALYPINPVGSLYLSSIAPGGIVSISDEKSVIMRAVYRQGTSSLEFFDLSLGRHVGTVLASSTDALASLVNTSEIRRFYSANTKFAATCVFPIVNDGVTSINVGNIGASDGSDGVIRFTNTDDDAIRVSTTGDDLRFDIIPPYTVLEQTSIQHIYCIVDGRTPFRIEKIPFITDSSDSSAGLGNTIAVYLDNIERQEICSNKHREDSLEMTDTCKDCESSNCHDDPIPPTDIPETYQVEVVDIPNGAESSFYLTVPNMLGYDNPLSITLSDGEITPKTEITVDANNPSIDALTDSLTSKGAIIQVPGLNP